MISVVRQLRWAGAIGAFAMLLAACGASAPATPAANTSASESSSTGAAGVAIKIGAVVPLTGRYAGGATLVKNGYELAVEDINKAGGIDVGGRKLQIELTVLDDESDATKTVQRLETLNSSNQVSAYLGGFGSDLHAAAAAVAEKNKIPYVGVAFALKKIHENGYKYLFSPFIKSPDIAKASFDTLDSLNPKPTKVAIFAEKTDWGAELAALWRDEAQKRGYQIVADEEYAPGAKDFAQLITKAKDGGAEALLTLPNGQDGATIVKQMKELAYTPAAGFFIRATDSATWASNLGKDGDYAMSVFPWSSSVTYPGSQEMATRYQAKFNAPALATVASAYAAVQVLADAITRAKSTDRLAIRDALAATDLMTVVGPVKFNPDGTASGLPAVAVQYQNGQIVTVWPKEQSQGAVAYPAKPFAQR
jgi:branched-chain amino acid transport system substrate-binding protein